MGDTVTAEIRGRFEAMATGDDEVMCLSGGVGIHVEWIAFGHFRARGETKDAPAEGDWAAWVALAENILGVSRLEIAGLFDRCEKLEAERDALRTVR